MFKKLTSFIILLTIISAVFCACNLQQTDGNEDGEAGNINTPALNTEDITLRINEFSTSNTQTLSDKDGDFVGWVEIYNYGDKAVSLNGLSLSDNEDKPDKWFFPDIEIKENGYLVVFVSDKAVEYKEGKELHADFSLSNKDKSIGIYNGQTTITKCDVVELISNLSFGYADDGKYLYFPKATPGKENTVKGFDKIGSADMCKEKEIVISEMYATHQSSYDYIELYNPTDKPVSLSSYRLSDSPKLSKAIRLETEAVIRPESYYTVYCDNSTRYNKRTNETFVDMGLNRYGDEIYIFDENGVVVDSVEYTSSVNGYSCGRNVKAGSELVYFEGTSPSKKNPAKALKAPVKTPEFDTESSFVKKGTTVGIIADDATVRYTLDGSLPTEKSPVLRHRILINKTVNIRVRAFRKGCVPSEAATATYIVGRKPDMPVFFLTAAKADLYSKERGILASNIAPGDDFPYKSANYWKDWARPANIQYLDEKGSEQLDFNAGIKVFGQYSRALDQKSISINLKDKYGPKEICYPFFEGNDVNVFSAFVLRNSGQDNSRAFLRDAFCSMVIKNQVDVAFMDYKPVVVYLNGEYHGIYDLREKIDEDYFANHEGIDRDSIDIIKGARTVNNGTIDNYQKLMNYLATHDLSVKENYDYICSIVDIDNIICYWMIESFFNNTDTGNIKYYRGQNDDSKWRIVLFDLDWALFPSTYKNNMVKSYINPRGHGVGNMFSTRLMCSLIKNPQFRKRLIELNSQHYKTTFKTERMLKIYDEMVDNLKDEMPYHTKKWGSPASYKDWERECATLRRIIAERPELFKNAFCSTFGLSEAEKEKYFGQE